MHNRKGSNQAIDTGIKSGGGTAANHFKVNRNGKSAVSRGAVKNNLDYKDDIISGQIIQANSPGFDNDWTFSRQQ
jgi:hypothetical protein